MPSSRPDWLETQRGNAPLLMSLPHTGLQIPVDCQDNLTSLWLACKDCDWWIEKLYDFARDLDATVVRTRLSRTVIDVNRDPAGITLYPGQFTTGLCPVTTFDNEPLYRDDKGPDAEEIARRKMQYFAPYHDALQTELDRLRATHRTVVLYDCHSIRSVIPALFEGTLPHFNIGTHEGRACHADLTQEIAAQCAASGLQHVVNGRFKGGYITRHYGAPEKGVHVVQMELACRTYMPEPLGTVNEAQWPTAYDTAYAEPARATLVKVLESCRSFALKHG
ncbi:MAG: N-formylglutamate deformylase [Beijerinckiaceae bacterium]